MWLNCLPQTLFHLHTLPLLPVGYENKYEKRLNKLLGVLGRGNWVCICLHVVK